jgi:hypothetical protein
MAVVNVSDVRSTLFYRQLLRHLVEWVAEV